ncbi:MAG TPA: hypothetical protein VIF60_21080 [Burkholderiaceae bacterium]
MFSTRTLNLLILLGMTICVAALIRGYPLPDAQRIDQAVNMRDADRLGQTVLGKRPEQLPPVDPRFETTVAGSHYYVQPIVHYELDSLIVSLHDSDGFMDFIHSLANDKLNVMDLCLAWGEFTRSGGYSLFHFSNGQFSCSWESGNPEAQQYAGVGGMYLDNYHILSDKPFITKQLRSLHVGDQVHISGFLANYGFAGGPQMRESSLGRQLVGDKPAGCEVFYVEEVQIIKRGPGYTFWRPVFWGGVVLTFFLLVFWFKTPYRNPHAR